MRSPASDFEKSCGMLGRRASRTCGSVSNAESRRTSLSELGADPSSQSEGLLFYLLYRVVRVRARCAAPELELERCAQVRLFCRTHRIAHADSAESHRAADTSCTRHLGSGTSCTNLGQPLSRHRRASLYHKTIAHTPP